MRSLLKDLKSSKKKPKRKWTRDPALSQGGSREDQEVAQGFRLEKEKEDQPERIRI